MFRMSVTVAVILIVLAVAAVGVRRAAAHLDHGATAPDFTLQAAKGGDVETVGLKVALAKGPVVLYFFPKSFTSGCTVEAHLFAEHIGEYRKMGASVIGVSGDDIETQKKFSTQECRSGFLVASDPGLKVARAYDAALGFGFANRTSYVIRQDGTVALAYTNLDPSQHVAKTLDAVKRLQPPGAR